MKAILVTLFISSVLYTSAQTSTFRVGVGINYFNVDCTFNDYLSQDEKFDYDSRRGVSGNISYDLEFKQGLGLSSGVEYNAKRFRENYRYYAPSPDYQWLNNPREKLLHTIDVPLMARKYFYNPSDKATGFFLGLGGYYSFHAGASFIVDKSLIVSDILFTWIHGYKKSEFGAMASIGFDVYYFSFFTTYKYGLTNLLRSEDSNNSYYFRGWSFVCAYKFPVRK